MGEKYNENQVEEFDSWVADTHLMIRHYRRQVAVMVSSLFSALDVLARSAKLTLHSLLPCDEYCEGIRSFYTCEHCRASELIAVPRSNFRIIRYPLCFDKIHVSKVQECVLVSTDANLVRVWQSVILRAAGVDCIPDILSCFVCGNHPNGKLCVVEEGGLVLVSKQDLIDNMAWIQHLSGVLSDYRFHCVNFSLDCFKKHPSSGRLLFCD